MSDDLVKRLRSPANVFYEYAADEGAFLREAADRLEQIKELYLEYVDLSEERAGRIKKLEAALEKITKTPPFGQPQMIARAALEGKNE